MYQSLVAVSDVLSAQSDSIFNFLTVYSDLLRWLIALLAQQIKA